MQLPHNKSRLYFIIALEVAKKIWFWIDWTNVLIEMNNNNCEPNVLKEKIDKLNKFVTGKF
jgi:hypothetical protein